MGINTRYPGVQTPGKPYFPYFGANSWSPRSPYEKTVQYRVHEIDGQMKSPQSPDIMSSQRGTLSSQSGVIPVSFHNPSPM